MLKGSKKENSKNIKFTIRLTEDEYKMISEKSQKNNMTMSKYLLHLVKKDK